jgi:hypothetical protein
MRALRRAALGALSLSCLACSDIWDKLLSCEGEDPATPAFESDTPPDWEGEIEVTEDAPFLGITSGLVRVQVWDCIDGSWWTDVGPQKVIQAFVDDTECLYEEAVVLETAPCDSEDTPDLLHRDLDGDGVTAAQGDPDDRDPSVSEAPPADSGGADGGAQDSGAGDSGGGLAG